MTPTPTTEGPIVTSDPVNPSAATSGADAAAAEKVGAGDLPAVWSRIGRKQAAGEALTPAEQALYEQADQQALDHIEGEADNRRWIERKQLALAAGILTEAEAEQAAHRAGRDAVFDDLLHGYPPDDLSHGLSYAPDDGDGDQDVAALDDDGAAGW